MANITVKRTAQPFPSEPELVIIRNFLFGCYKGINRDDDKGWKKMWKRLVDMDVGGVAFFEFVIPRNAKFHAKFFTMLDVGYEAWHPGDQKLHDGRQIEKNREQFREDILILAGFYETTFHVSGAVKLRARSISFAKMEQLEFEMVYDAVANVLLKEILTTYSGRGELDKVVERLLGFC